VAIAFLSVGNVRTPRPVLLGDTVRARVKLLEKRLTSKGHAGVVITSHQVRNQREEIVMEYEMTRMIKLRPAEPAAAAAG
jgi:acyl dehydratase